MTGFLAHGHLLSVIFIMRLIGLFIILTICPKLAADEPASAIVNRVKVPGTLNLHARTRQEFAPGSGQFDTADETLHWNVAATAIIVCDMWDDHWCASAAQRVKVMAPRMNEVLTAARSHGVQIIHAPSDTMDFYQDTSFRRRMQQAPTVAPPVEIARWCPLDSEQEPPLPVDDSAGGCDDPNPTATRIAWTRQHPAIDILDPDGVTDSGVEVFNFCRQEGIKHIVIMGVHTNMCVLGRSFGIRQLKALSFDVVLARDLTDAMYDPRQAPHVSHTRGTELIIEHIEAHWCPSVLSKELTSILPGSADSR